MKRLVSAMLASSTALLVPAMAVASPAIDLGQIFVGDDVASTVKAYQVASAPGTNFSQEYTFTLADDANLYASVSNTKIGRRYDVSGLEGILKKNGSTIATFSEADGVSNIVGSLPKSASYSLTVLGTSTGTVGGAFSLSLKAAAAAPVPGPAAWMVGLAGAGLVAFQYRRRNKATDKVAFG